MNSEDYGGPDNPIKLKQALLVSLVLNLALFIVIGILVY